MKSLQVSTATSANSSGKPRGGPSSQRRPEVPMEEFRAHPVAEITSGQMTRTLSFCWTTGELAIKADQRNWSPVSKAHMGADSGTKSYLLLVAKRHLETGPACARHLSPLPQRHGRGDAFEACCSCRVAAEPRHVLRYSGVLSATMNA